MDGGGRLRMSDEKVARLALGWLGFVCGGFFLMGIHIYGLFVALKIVAAVVVVVLTALSLCVLDDISDT
jgi:uncharacterized membrane protein